MTGPPEKKIVLWCITDNKPGHKNQLRGLVAALEERIHLDIHFIDVQTSKSLWQKAGDLLRWLTGRIPFDSSLPNPDWIAACGHSTHFSLLAAARQFSAKSILLMKPSLPSSWFDLCFVPEHDEPLKSENVVSTRGVLNVIRSSNQNESNIDRIALILIGGPSTHHDWQEENIVQQVISIREKLPQLKTLLTTSRRTPLSTTEKLQNLSDEWLTIVPVEQTDSSWVPDHLMRADQVFVTEDSVSMIYEAITSGAVVTVMDVPCKNPSSPGRIIKGLEQLKNEQFVLGFEKWNSGEQLPGTKPKLQEADRCAEIVIDRFLD